MPPRRATSTRRRPSASAPDTGSELRPAGNQVVVRMYGQGLGDCFLLAFPRSRGGAAGGAGNRADARPVYMVIDCGVIGGTPGGPARMKQIVADIKRSTLDPAVKDDAGQPMGHVDVLAITHEHWDHLSGFVQAEEEWQGIQVDAIWTAWTEKPEPGLPEVLKRIVEKQHRAMAAIADRAVRFGLSGQHETVLGLMSFLSDAMTLGEPFGATAGTGEAFDIAKGLVKDPEGHIFCEPGDVRRVPGTDAIAYVLGPPRNDDRLKQMNPTKNDPETYSEGLQGMAEGGSAFNAFALPLLGPSVAPPGATHDEVTVAAAEQDAYDRSFPFDRTLRVPLPVAERDALALKGGGGAPLYPALAAYCEELNGWRRIDFDWLAGAEAFALQADSLTNNTCLVLAFELPPAAPGAERKVLLFVGDAQVGNWLSWDDIKDWTPLGDATPSQAKPDISDLMQRTTFYKVGHHGSHNATLKAGGVERMPNLEAGRPLTAFVPVSPIVARELKDWCHMPLDVLLDALAARTGKRVVLANGNVWPPVDDPEALAANRERIGVEVSTTLLPPKIRPKDGKEIEGATTLWVQLAIPY